MRRAPFLLASLMLFSSATLAQILPTLSYQAVLTDTIVVAKPAGTIIGKAMTALKNGSGLVIPSLALTFLLGLVGMPALAQDVVVGWSAFTSGFGELSSGSSRIRINTGQSFVGESTQPDDDHSLHIRRDEGQGVNEVRLVVYVYRIHAGNVVQSKKLLLLRWGF